MMDATHFDAARRGNTNDFPFCEINNQNSSDIFDKVSPLGNSLLHVAAGSGNLEITELMARQLPILMTRKNCEGNTPLHFAVKNEKLNTTKVLVECAAQIRTSNTLMRMKNDDGNTALHVVLLQLKVAKKKRIDNLVAMTRYLISADPEVSYIVENNASKSPLHLAVESNNIDIIDYLLSALPQDAGLLDRLQRMKRTNLVHVAIEKKTIRDDEENTLLHCAASIGYLEGVNYLLEINHNWAFERNKKGLYPLHLACENGHAKIMKKLLKKWPDATEFLCNRGRSILHVAAMCGKEETVSCILKEKVLGELVNMKDKDGNTPLHLAALSCNPLVVATLLYHKRSKFDLVNNHGLTAYDFFLEEFQKVQDHGIDVNVGNLRETYDNDSSEMDFKRSDEPNRFQKIATSVLFYKKKKSFYPKNDDSSITKVALAHIKSKKRLSKEDVNSRINILFVVAALIVGSAYAGSLQMPVDGKSGDDVSASNATTTKWFVHSNINNTVWESIHGFPRFLLVNFVFDNVAAMGLSITAAFTLCSALLLDDTLATVLVNIAFSCLVFALAFMANAFLSAIRIGMKTYEIYSDDIQLVRVVLQLSQWLLVSIPLMILAFGGEALTRHILSIFFSIYFRLHRLWRMVHYPLLDRRIAKCGRRILVGFFILFLFLFLVLFIWNGPLAF
ncbi:hypothetical protein Ddye_018591 [Dipteronia dyeriana]|uniref:PGG domain-containing protein n=1 Tax=Dipteronia dyeriana TaxID=168575 RepID=A0AAD9UBH9_9ROSI|nr:hypothetical protein Ddye_018591 [Dipteronia dyeriana]